MGKGARSNAAKRSTVACAGDGKEQQRKAMPETDAQKVARPRARTRLAFVKAALAEAKRYMDMEEEEVVEEYRQAGKLHCYDLDTEWKKRFARVFKLHPCPCSNQMAANIVEYMFYLEENEDDFRMGLYSLIGPGDQS